MEIFYLTTLLIPFLALRLDLEGPKVLVLVENLLLIIAIELAEVSWCTAFTTLAFFVASAFCQIQVEYYNSTSKIGETVSTNCPCYGAQNISASAACDSRNNSTCKSRRNGQFQPNNKDLPTLEPLHGRVTLFPCDLRHLRRSSFKDDYHHSYLYVGTPVGSNSVYSPLISVEPQRYPRSFLPMRKAWFSVRPEDHGFNGGKNLSMDQKLKEFLVSEVRLNQPPTTGVG